MKKILHICLCTFLLSLLANSCIDPTNKPTKPTFNAALLNGHWMSGTLHEYYNANGTGYTWDTADDIYEDEAQQFTWSMNNATLVQNHQMGMGGVVPKTYTITRLTATTLCYRDNYGTSYTFLKQE